MERYCFYCGKKLLPGERCGCRYAQQRQQEFKSDDYVRSGRDSSTAKATTNPQGADEDNSTAGHRTTADSDQKAAGRTKEKQRRAARFTDFFTGRKKQGNRSTRSKGKRAEAAENKGTQGGQNKGRSFFQQAFVRGRETGRLPLSRLLQLLLRQPSAALKETAELPLAWLAGLQVVEAVLYFSLGSRIVSNTNLGTWLIFATLRSDNKLNMGGIYLFLALAAILLSGLNLATRGISYKLVAGRPPRHLSLSFKDHFRALIPGSFYYQLFLLLANGFAFGTGMVGAAMVITGLGVRFLVDFKSQQTILKADSDQFFWRALLALALQFICQALLCQLLLPNVVSFNFHPLV